MTAFTQFEFTLLNWIVQTFKHEYLDAIMPKISFLGDKGWIWIALGLLFMFRKSTRRIGTTVLLALLFSLIVANIVLKPLVARTRPFDINTTYQLLIDPPGDYSFPSGHAQAAFAAASVISHNMRFLGGAAMLLAAAISFSRLYLYLHFTCDVLAGAIIGYILGSIADTLVTEIRYRRYAKKRRLSKKAPLSP